MENSIPSLIPMEDVPMDESNSTQEVREPNPEPSLVSRPLSDENVIIVGENRVRSNDAIRQNIVGDYSDEDALQFALLRSVDNQYDLTSEDARYNEVATLSRRTSLNAAPAGNLVRQERNENQIILDPSRSQTFQNLEIRRASSLMSFQTTRDNYDLRVNNPNLANIMGNLQPGENQNAAFQMIQTAMVKAYLKES